ncbi:MAG: hypothetical protein JNJ40_12805 [Bacteroidia bacterium]|nr:hypothetical protein [Bacteroidia bacterium]
MIKRVQYLQSQFAITFFFSLIVVFSNGLKAQELFPHNEPASNVPKGVLGIRPFYKTYPEVNLLRRMYALRVMYGLLQKLTVMGTISVTNHHGKDLPPDLVTHTHVGAQTNYYTNTIQRGIKYPYKFSGVYLYAKYRFITRDNKNQHFRMAAYADWSNVGVPHDEAEPNLMDDTRGYGGGLITTYLKNHFAVSFTGGFIIPKYYEGFSPDIGGQMIPTKIEYGRAAIYNLSFGYLLLPKTYKSYNQTNINLYVEFIGKSFEAAVVTQYGYMKIPIQTPLLQKGNYVEVHPSIQAVFDSNLRIDLSVGLPLIRRSYARFYPVYYLGIQRYIFPGARKVLIKKAKDRVKRNE